MGTTSHKGKLRGTSIYELGKTVKRAYGSGKVNPDSKSIVDGLKPVKVNLEEGYHIVEPKHLASFLVPRQEVKEGRIHGFQRPEITRPHIRRISESIQEGTPMPAIEVAQYKNSLWIVDGQHRALGGIDANSAMPVLVRRLDAEQQRQLFASQSRARRVDPSTLVLSADDDYSEYIQDAVTSNSNPWNDIVTYSTSSTTRITPNQMFTAIIGYMASAVRHDRRIVDTVMFERSKADELAMLYKAFGNKKTNPLAFKPLSLKAITYAAIFVIRRTGSRPQDIERWINWMPIFQFNEYQGLRSSKELGTAMIRHWNKRLSVENKIILPDELM